MLYDVPWLIPGRYSGLLVGVCFDMGGRQLLKREMATRLVDNQVLFDSRQPARTSRLSVCSFAIRTERLPSLPPF